MICKSIRIIYHIKSIICVQVAPWHVSQVIPVCDEVARTLRPKEGENELESKCVNQRWTKSPNWRNLRANELWQGSCSHSSFYSTQFDITGNSAVGLWLYYGWSSTTESLPLLRLAEISTLDVGLGEMKRKRAPRGLMVQPICSEFAEKSRKVTGKLFDICYAVCCVALWLPEAQRHDDRFHYEWSSFKWLISSQQSDPVTVCWQEVHSDTTSKIFIFNIIFKHHPEKTDPVLRT